MNKCKLVKSGGLTRLVIKSIKGQQINEHELYAINCNKVPGLLHLDYHKKKSSFKLSYDITGFMSFKKFLKTPMNKESFGKMLSSILNILKRLNASHFNPQCVLYDFSCTMVNEATKDVYLVYVPVQPFESPNTLREFLLGIIERCSFVPGEDNGYVREYITILNTGINFSVFDLEEYVNSLLGPDAERENYMECPKCHEMVPSKTAYCKCGTKLYGFSGDIGTYDPLGQKRDDETIEEEEKIENVIDEGTCVLVPPTTVLGTSELQNKAIAYLVRKKTGEEIKINKDLFVLGKSQQNADYAIVDNSAVSRTHAKIISREDRFFVYDMKSTNRTYVDGKVIPSEEDFEIFHDTELRFANEDFIFCVE